MEALDTTILNTAVPAIAHALNVPPLSMKAVLASYTLSLAVFIPISGWMANRFGTRRVFSWAIANIYLGLAAVRPIERHSCAGGLPHSARRRRRDDAAGGANHHGPRLPQIRIGPRVELRGHSEFGCADARSGPRRRHHPLLSLECDFLREYPDRPVGPVSGVSAPAELPRAAQCAARHRGFRVVRLRDLAAVLCPRGIRRNLLERAGNARAAHHRRGAAGRLRPALHSAPAIHCCGWGYCVFAPCASR